MVSCYNRKLGLNRLKLPDISIGCMVVATFSFHDKTSLLLATQLFCFAVVSFTAIKNNEKLPVYLAWWLIFTAYCLSSFFWSQHNTTLISCVFSIIQAALEGTIIILYAKTLEKIDRVMNMVVISSLILCIRMIIQVPVAMWGTERVGQYIGYGNVSATYSLSYPSLLCFYLGQKKRKIIYYLLALILTVFSLLTGSKKAILIVAIGVPLLIILASKDIKKVAVNVLISFLLILLIYYAVMNIKWVYQVVGVRLEYFINQFLYGTGDASTRNRLLLVQYSSQTFFSSPIIGIGLDNFRYTNPLGLYAHNNYLELLSCLGSIGIVLYYSYPLYVFCIATISIIRGDKRYNILIVMLICLFFMDAATVSYSNEAIQQIIAIMVSLFCFVRKTNSVSKENKMIDNSNRVIGQSLPTS